MRNEQIVKAALLGTQAYKNGVQCAPCLDAELMEMLTGRAVGVTPANEASSVEIMQTWSNSWTAANLADELGV